MVEIDRSSRFSLPSFSVDQPTAPPPEVPTKKSAKHPKNGGEIFSAESHTPRSFTRQLRDSFKDAGVPIQDGTVSSQLRNLLDRQK